MDKQNFEVRISISDIWHIFLNKLWVIILAALVAGGGVYAYSFFTYDPEYTSVSKIYILRQDQDGSQSPSGYAQDFNVALATVNDCKLIVKTSSTLNKVIDELDLELSVDRLSQMITLSSSDDSRIVQISVITNDPELSKEIADTLSVKGVERIKEVMGIEQATVMEYGALPTSPSNSVFDIKVWLVGLVAGILTFAVYLILYLSNDRIVDPEDVANHLGLSVLGIIPNEDDMASKKKYKRYYSPYKSKKHMNAHECKANTDKSTTQKSKKGEVK